MTAKLIIAQVQRHRDQTIVLEMTENDKIIVVTIETRISLDEMHLLMQIIGAFYEMETEHQLVSSESNLL